MQIQELLLKIIIVLFDLALAFMSACCCIILPDCSCLQLMCNVCSGRPWPESQMCLLAAQIKVTGTGVSTVNGS